MEKGCLSDKDLLISRVVDLAEWLRVLEDRINDLTREIEISEKVINQKQ